MCVFLQRCVFEKIGRLNKQSMSKIWIAEKSLRTNIMLKALKDLLCPNYIAIFQYSSTASKWLPAFVTDLHATIKTSHPPGCWGLLPVLSKAVWIWLNAKILKDIERWVWQCSTGELVAFTLRLQSRCRALQASQGCCKGIIRSHCNCKPLDISGLHIFRWGHCGRCELSTVAPYQWCQPAFPMPCVATDVVCIPCRADMRIQTSPVLLHEAVSLFLVDMVHPIIRNGNSQFEQVPLLLKSCENWSFLQGLCCGFCTSQHVRLWLHATCHCSAEKFSRSVFWFDIEMVR